MSGKKKAAAKRPAKAQAAASKQPIMVTFVLDRSGSMASCRDATISGFNEWKNDQKQHGNVLFSLTTFNQQTTIEHPARPVGEIPDLTLESYVPGGNTALYDAIGRTVALLETKLAAEVIKPVKNLFVIMTDGEENASREFTRQRIFDLIESKRKAGWDFVFLGANQDAFATGASLGVPQGATMHYVSTHAGVKAASSVLRGATMAYMSSASPAAGGKFFGYDPIHDPQIQAVDWQKPPVAVGGKPGDPFVVTPKVKPKHERL